MKKSESQVNISRALFLAKGEFPPIAKTARGQAGNRHFMYAPLDEILRSVEPVLRANGLMITQGTDGHELVTTLEHPESGEWREHRMPLNAEHANMQSYGIEVSYRRRYAIPLMLGVVTEDDNDIKERNRKSGVDHTQEKKAGTSAREVALGEVFRSMQPEIQDHLRRSVEHAEKAMPNAANAANILSMARDNWPDFDQAELIKAQWYLLGSATRSAIKAHETRSKQPI